VVGLGVGCRVVMSDHGTAFSRQTNLAWDSCVCLWCNYTASLECYVIPDEYTCLAVDATPSTASIAFAFYTMHDFLVVPIRSELLFKHMVCALGCDLFACSFVPL
jgi:hypothetical protein